MNSNTTSVNTSVPTPSLSPTLRWQIIIANIVRFALSTSRRFIYPFAPALSRGMGLPISNITSLISMTWAASLIGIFFGPLADRWGYRRVMLLGLGMSATCLLLSGLTPIYSLLLVTLFLTGVGLNIFSIAFISYVGRHVPYQQRGMVVGLGEMSWAGSTLIGIPLVGLLIAQWGWRSPFFAIGGITAIGFLFLSILLPKDELQSHQASIATDMLETWRQLLKEKTFLSLLVYSFAFSVANDTLFVTYGLWLEASFELGVVILGLTVTVIGVAELLGEVIGAFIADRLGLKRSLIIGTLLTTLSYGLLPFFTQTLFSSLAALFVIFLFFEFMIVAGLSLFTEISNEARASVMAGYRASGGMGRIVGAMIGIPIWTWGGITSVGFAAMGINLVALGAILWGFRRWQRGEG